MTARKGRSRKKVKGRPRSYRTWAPDWLAWPWPRMDRRRVKCGACGGLVQRTIDYAVRNHVTGEVRYLHPACLHPRTADRRRKAVLTKKLVRRKSEKRRS